MADVAGPQWACGVVEDGEDAWVVRVLGQLQTSCRTDCLDRGSGGEADHVRARDGEVFQMQFGPAELGLQGVDPGAEIVDQGPGGVFLKVECLEKGVQVDARALADRAR
ncbi:hypothetical protein [Streptomyces mirabilis]|uniref:hypothetical protein n=1 Tax=Streptomyces mirabilis TaxID=68239 RepID=UPI00369E7624